VLRLSDIPADEIRAFALENHATPREIAFILKGETRLVRGDLRTCLPSWTGVLRNASLLALFPVVSRALEGDSSYFLTEGKKLISFLGQDIESVIPLHTPQLRKIKKEIGPSLFNLLVETTPERYETRVLAHSLHTVAPGDIATVTGTVIGWKKAWKSTAPWTLTITVGDMNIPVSFFGKVGPGYAVQFPEGTDVIISGEVSVRTILPSFTNPEIFKYDAVWQELLSGYVPAYRKITGVSRLFFLRTMREAVLRLMKFNGDWLPYAIRAHYEWPDLIMSIINIHFPAPDTPPEDLETQRTIYHRRLAFDKMFFFQYGSLLERIRAGRSKERRITVDTPLAREIEASLPFPLTTAQKRVLAEIRRDLASLEPMARLLQGDVGSGKTIVMLLAACDVIASGYRVAIMAPTEILARQHYETVKCWAPNISAALVIGGTSGKKKRTMLEQALLSRLIIGTHALYENLHTIPDLGFVIIDEQHRFGVAQRMALVEKATHPDLLVASATPIPRSLALTIYGGVDISVLNEMPPGRLPVRTRVVPFANRSKVVDYIVSIITNEKKKGYWICPLVEESEKSDLAPVTAVYEEFRTLLGDMVQLLHGRMKNEEKSRILSLLREGTVRLLVSTIVVEVGVDIPDASFIVVENADRFGLAQLHQIRGRVGRSYSMKSFAAFIAGEQASPKALERLSFMEKTTDGFKIAEYDLKQRGPGALTGLEQSGFRNDPYYLLAAQYGIEVQKASQAARRFLNDPGTPDTERQFVTRVFDLFFKERFKKVRLG